MLEEIGMSATAMEELHFFLRHQHGMILVVGNHRVRSVDPAGGVSSQISPRDIK